MQFQVPQFIDTDDKVVGPLSLKQFAYVAAAAILSALFYFFTYPWLWVLASIFFFGIAIALAFVKVQGRPFANVIVSAFNFYWKPQTYIWKPGVPVEHPSQEKVQAETTRSGLEDILAKSAARVRSAMIKPTKAFQAKPMPVEQPKPISRETVSAGSALHKNWEDLQTGSPLAKKNSDKEFLEKKMAERYQIFQRISGERNAAKRVDYR